MKIFWSWQSDTPGKTGRHFVRKVLNQAVEALKQKTDVEEPTERETRDALHVDQDRQGVPGSPDLARTILDKIDASRVVIADVTPVSVISATGKSGKARPEKRNMNPNVAIELGYALKALSDRNVLLVLNTHYGDRSFLPFDLAHKAGPITFDLPPGSNRAKQEREAQSLKGKLVSALRPYIGAAPGAAHAASDPFPEVRSTLSAAVYFESREALAELGERGDKAVYCYMDGEAFYLRLIPTKSPAEPFTRRFLYDQVSQAGLLPLHRTPHGFCGTNRFGAIVFEPVGPTGPLAASTQLFANGELWGIAAWLLFRHAKRRYVPAMVVEETFRAALPKYVDFMYRFLGVDPPYTVEAGVVGLNGREFLVGGPPDDPYGPFYDNELKVRLTLNDTTAAAVDAALLRFFERLFKHSGYGRPVGYAGFPATQS